ncbi:hypothetical protein [Bradyrhizobium sp. AS23.2]|uniref:hypothetical protein n=1 Tax=Bradyrhizobium sp. AS23.2 TaxID=1680155 RepID=UPI00093F1FDF|nr:hypothetical protein [Bradyrhizobium sp. AS23.2]OKO80966.1 hypothetical protein AC630_15010 [Bradyrhizobium sp. AS23.2]
MIRSVVALILAACLTIPISQANAATDEQRQAIELLRVALDCRSPVQQGQENKTVNQFRFVGDEETLIIEVDSSSVWMPTKTQSPTAAGQDTRSLFVFAAKYADLDPTEFKAIEPGCRNAELCASNLTLRHEGCESRRDGQKVCDSLGAADAYPRSDSAVSFKGICPSQLANVTLALTTLHAGAKQSVRGKYMPRVDNALDAVPIREQRTTNSNIIGGIGWQSSPVNLTNCSGGWCQIKWGETIGYVQKANFTEARR